jgi:23S rRNA (uridine2552-2'-O)-methyltransferase
MKRPKKKHNRWEDHYTRQAKADKYPARSVYKLQEIQRKFRLIREGNNVLDLGCTPGSWLLYAAQETGDKGEVVGIDLKPVKVKLPKNVRAFAADINSLDSAWWQALGIRFDVVVSDMAPATTGNRVVDAARSYNLAEMALETAKSVLKPGGAFTCKIFQGPDVEQMTQLVRAEFKQTKIFKPKSTRKASTEVYLIGLNKTGGRDVRT